jgi:hypothetical protein
MSIQHKQPVAGSQVPDRGPAGQRQPSEDQQRQQVLAADDFADQSEFLEDGSGDRRGRGLPGTDDVRSDRNDDERSECR